MVSISLLGAPTDVGASRLGCRLGPAALRVAGLQPALERFGCDVTDAGDVTGPPNPQGPRRHGYRNLHEVAFWVRAVHAAVRTELGEGRLPVLLGGDHSMSIGSVSAVAAHARAAGRRLRVLWIDAHADFNTAALSPSGNIHGMPVACLTGHGPRELTSFDGADGPCVRPDEIREIGLRDVDPGEKAFLAEQGVEVFDMRYIDEFGMRATMERALADLDVDAPDGAGRADGREIYGGGTSGGGTHGSGGTHGNGGTHSSSSGTHGSVGADDAGGRETYGSGGTHLHVSLDLDVIDPDIAPGVGTPARGGATYREIQLVMEMIADTGRLGSLDIMELNPAADIRNETAELAVDLVESLFGKSTLVRPRR